MPPKYHSLFIYTSDTVFTKDRDIITTIIWVTFEIIEKCENYAGAHGYFIPMCTRALIL